MPGVFYFLILFFNGATHSFSLMKVSLFLSSFESECQTCTPCPSHIMEFNHFLHPYFVGSQFFLSPKSLYINIFIYKDMGLHMAHKIEVWTCNSGLQSWPDHFAILPASCQFATLLGFQTSFNLEIGKSSLFHGILWAISWIVLSTCKMIRTFLAS